VDELPALDRRLALFKHNRRGLFSFHDRDMVTGAPESVARLAAGPSGITADARAGCSAIPHPGYVFNPLSVWFCDDREGALKAIIYEVHNTMTNVRLCLAGGRRSQAGATWSAKAFICLALSVARLPLPVPHPPAGRGCRHYHPGRRSRHPILNASFAGARAP